MDTAYYHISDPLENFILKVIVRESSRAITGDTDRRAAVYNEDVTISWQEKIDGPADIIKSHLKGQSAPQTIGNLPVTAAHEGLSDVMLYTYVDKDHYWTDKVGGIEKMVDINH